MSELPIKEIRVTLPPNKDMPGGYSNNMIVNHGEYEFNLYFYEVVSPIIMGTEEQKQKMIAELEKIDALPVARIVIPARKLKSFIRALQTNLENYEDRFGTLPDEESDEEE